MAIRNTVFTPARRGPTLADAAGGTSERVSSRERDPVLRNRGWKTQDIRLTAGGTDASAGHAALYNLGAPDVLSVGRYLITQQGAASATAEPLGAITYFEAEVREQTAGVFVVDYVQHRYSLVTTVVEDTLQDMSNTVTANRTADVDAPDFDSNDADVDSVFAIFIAAGTQVTELTTATLTQGSVPALGDMCLYDTLGASTRVYTIERMS